ncbi:hypothetical protein [Cellulomonas endophytica]|uniref:hypothetical protein n=1 Tax=Cellulomonas endophytica TaxID=2494735 RepID=UPI001013ABD8|nr:hypothetical protein [Cellulomonas endophytica]
MAASDRESVLRTAGTLPLSTLARLAAARAADPATARTARAVRAALAAQHPAQVHATVRALATTRALHRPAGTRHDVADDRVVLVVLGRAAAVVSAVLAALTAGLAAAGQRGWGSVTVLVVVAVACVVLAHEIGRVVAQDRAAALAELADAGRAGWTAVLDAALAADLVEHLDEPRARLLGGPWVQHVGPLPVPVRQDAASPVAAVVTALGPAAAAGRGAPGTALVVGARR